MKQIFSGALFAGDKKILWLAAGVILLKLLLLPFAQTVDADAVTRTFLSEDWLNNPAWITNSDWGPFHFYLTGAMLAMWNNPIYAPIVLNIILSAFTLLPFYYFVKREFNSTGAFVASFFLAISPIIFRNSLMNMSETPYLLFITLTLNFLSKGFKENRVSNFILAGLFITIAAGFRFEAWFFILLMSIIIFIKNEKINFVLFFIIALLYPATDIVTHFVQDHYSVTGFFSGYPWNFKGNLAPPNFQDYLRRIWFIPFCWFISVGPIAFIILRELFRLRKRNDGLFWCAILFWAFLLLTEIFALRGALVLHERFAATITLLSLPFIAPYYKELTAKKNRIAIVFAALTLGLTFAYNMSNITPLPRLADQNGEKVAKLIGTKLTPESAIILDFWDWENTYYIALQSKLPTHSIFIRYGDNKDTIASGEINAVIKKHQQGIVILVKNSLLWQNVIFTDKHLQFKFSNVLLATQEIFSNKDVVAWFYKVEN
jgi:4-amino-4-deoxy-L-arabinose transferase-like glycosyltransferase